jgi:hypothetical protein
VTLIRADVREGGKWEAAKWGLEEDKREYKTNEHKLTNSWGDVRQC